MSHEASVLVGDGRFNQAAMPMREAEVDRAASNGTNVGREVLKSSTHVHVIPYVTKTLIIIIRPLIMS
jgi:hypothetical protein